MRLIAALTEKSWLTPGLHPAHEAWEEQPEGGWDKGIGLGLFLCVVTFVFVLLTGAYLMRMGLHQSLGHRADDWYGIVEPPLLWFNTFLLAASSLVFHRAAVAARAGQARRLKRSVIGGGLLGFGFLAGQLFMWRQMEQSGYGFSMRVPVCTTTGDPLALSSVQLVTGNPAVAFFYLIVAFHAVHLLGGLIAWALTANRILDGAAPAAVARPVQLCARYWHFLLLVWLAMLALFVST